MIVHVRYGFYYKQFVIGTHFSNTCIMIFRFEDFGYKWVKEKDEEKKRNKCTEQKEQIAEQPPPTKRRKVQSSEEKDSTDLSTEKEAQEIPEGLKLVPGMNGLSVDFVRDVFYGNIGDGFYENICSDQLPRGR